MQHALRTRASIQLCAGLDREPFQPRVHTDWILGPSVERFSERGILDLSLPDGNAADPIPELHAANPHATAVVLTSSIDPGEGARLSNVARRPCSTSSITST